MNNTESTPSDKTYVFDNVEVKSTGRIATKIVELTTKKFVDTLLEIEPVDKTGPRWKKWVKKTDLYEVTLQDPVE